MLWEAKVRWAIMIVLYTLRIITRVFVQESLCASVLGVLLVVQVVGAPPYL